MAEQATVIENLLGQLLTPDNDVIQKVCVK